MNVLCSCQLLCRHVIIHCHGQPDPLDLSRWINQSCQEQFILLGFSDQPRLEHSFFVFVLIFYLVALVGNIVIILVSCLDLCLHTPMYFFLTNLSFLDLCFTTSSIPQLLFNLGSQNKTISYAGVPSSSSHSWDRVLQNAFSWRSWQMTASLQSASRSTILSLCTLSSVGSWAPQLPGHVSRDYEAATLWKMSGEAFPV